MHNLCSFALYCVQTFDVQCVPEKKETYYFTSTRMQVGLILRSNQGTYCIEFILGIWESTIWVTHPSMPDSSFGTNTVAMHTELNPMVLHLWTPWYCLGLSVNISRIPIVNYTGELPALSCYWFSIRIVTYLLTCAYHPSRDIGHQQDSSHQAGPVPVSTLPSRYSPTSGHQPLHVGPVTRYFFPG